MFSVGKEFIEARISLGSVFEREQELGNHLWGPLGVFFAFLFSCFFLRLFCFRNSKETVKEMNLFVKL